MTAIIKSRVEDLEKYIDIAPLSNVERIEVIAGLYEDRKIVHYKTALNVIKQLASQHTRAKDSKKAINNYNKIYEKYILARPRVKDPTLYFKPTFELKRGDYDIPQTTTEIVIRKGVYKSSVFKDVLPIINDEIKVILSKKPSFKVKLRMEVLIYRDKIDENGDPLSALVKEMLATDYIPRAVTNGNVNTIGAYELKALEDKCEEVGTTGEKGSG